MLPSPTETPTRKTPTPHVNCLHGKIEFAIPTDAMSIDAMTEANKLVSAAVKVLTDAKAYAKAEANFGRKPGTLFK